MTMKLTQKQELLVTRYVREVSRCMGDGADGSESQVLARLRGRITRELEGRPTETTLSDDDVLDVLERFGPPETVARKIAERTAPGRESAPISNDPRWLGVCSHAAAHLGVRPGPIRALLLALGLGGPLIFLLNLGFTLTALGRAIAENPSQVPPWPGVSSLAVLLALSGPFLLGAYLAAYVALYLASEPGSMPRIEKAKLAKFLVATSAAALAFHYTMRGALALINFGYVRVVGERVPDLGPWAWIDGSATSLLLCVLWMLLPVAALSGLPVPNQWDQTGKRVVQAGIAVYALVLCLGIASVLAGCIFFGVEAFTA